jgi:hypothetical protein
MPDALRLALPVAGAERPEEGGEESAGNTANVSLRAVHPEVSRRLLRRRPGLIDLAAWQSNERRLAYTCTSAIMCHNTANNKG